MLLSDTPFSEQPPILPTPPFLWVNSKCPLFGEISTMTFNYKGRFSTVTPPFSHTNSLELTSNLKLLKQKLKKTNTKLEINLQ